MMVVTRAPIRSWNKGCSKPGTAVAKDETDKPHSHSGDPAIFCHTRRGFIQFLAAGSVTSPLGFSRRERLDPAEKELDPDKGVVALVKAIRRHERVQKEYLRLRGF
jgi:hypothetical protein